MKHHYNHIILIAIALGGLSCKGNLSSNNAPDDPIVGENNAENNAENNEFEGTIPDVDACKDVAVDPGPFNAKRMTDWEYIRTVRDSFGIELEADVEELFPKDARVDGFTNTGSGLVTNIDHIIAYEALATRAVAKIADWPAYVGTHTSCTDDTAACREELIQNLGHKAFRRPLLDDEVALYVPLFQVALDEGDDFNMGAELVFRALFQSPQFLFRLDAQQGATEETKNVSSYEMASRLSYLVWATSPDDTLYARAAEDGLQTEAQILEEVNRMLADPKAREASARYVRDWLALDATDNLVRDEIPEFTSSLVDAMKAETLMYFESQIWGENVVLSELFTSQKTFATRELAEFYGFDNPQDGLTQYDLSAYPERIGFMTHAGILAVSGKAAEPSVVERGLFVMNGILCGVVENELDVVPELPPREFGKSQRYYAEQRLASAGCANCHIQFDPFGMALERFDGVGQYVTNDEFGNELLEEGEFLDETASEIVGYSSVADFVEKVSQTEAAKDCMIKKPVQFALGRSLIQSDACMLGGIKSSFDPTTTTYQDLIRSIATNPYFRVVRAASVDEPTN